MPYSQIMLVALFPALMYFFIVFMMVHYYAKKNRGGTVSQDCLGNRAQ